VLISSLRLAISVLQLMRVEVRSISALAISSWATPTSPVVWFLIFLFFRSEEILEITPCFQSSIFLIPLVICQIE
jgi:hypothetical protein